ncbi:hypothetical protein BH23PLA1_BH23PLA1_28140 [soil metagenome]
MREMIPVLMLFLSIPGQGTAQSLPERSWFPKAPPLPQPRGEVINVATAEELAKAAERIKPGGTILVSDGHYLMGQYFELRVDNVTLRGASGNRSRVVIDGAASRHGELIGISECSGVTIADLTIQNVRWNGIKINSDREPGVHRVTIRNCAIHNVWQRGIKVVRSPQWKSHGCVIEYCLFYNNRPKRYSDDPDDTQETFGGNYIGGIDAMDAIGWTIRDNVFIGLRGRTFEGPGAVFLWFESQDSVIERNVIIDCDVGISLGNAHKPEDIGFHCRGFIARNNMITRSPEQAIAAAYTEDCLILHNTVHDPENRRRRSIRAVGSNSGLHIENNLISGFPLRIESSENVRMKGNITRDDAREWFVNPTEGNLRLRAAIPGIVDAGQPLSWVIDDIDRQQRDGHPDIGSDEWSGGKTPAR